MQYILVTGASKGIGRGFVEAYLSRPETTVIAAVRTPDAEEAQNLFKLPLAADSKLVVVKIDALSDVDAAEAVETLRQQGLDRLDVVIANAGIFTLNAFQKLEHVDPREFSAHYDVNVVGPLRLYQATVKMLTNSPSPKFILVSSLAGTITGMEAVWPFLNSAYGASKAGANYLVRKLHFEQPQIATLAFHPGSVRTTEALRIAQATSAHGTWIEVEESVKGMIHEIDKVGKENGSGSFIGHDGGIIPW